MKLAIVIPCVNEGPSIGAVVADHRSFFPEAEIVVCDNCSTDDTAERALRAGARVIREPRPGKGFALRRLFHDVEADVYVMTDGDGTYSAEDAKRLLEALGDRASSLVTGDRRSSGAYERTDVRRFHGWGNAFIAWTISKLFHVRLKDPLSGLRVLPRAFVKAVPLISTGFEIETELTLQAVDKGFVTREFPIRYGNRPEGNPSKLNTVADGLRILEWITRFLFYFRPIFACWSLSALFMAASFLLGLPPLIEFFRYQYVYKVPSLVVSTGFAVLAIGSFFTGVILESLRYARRESFVKLDQHRIE
jgi:glycosyltransferase involved in cell wall biosynthesis